ncbi:MAG: F0F1 ATP synthase subunit A [Clostridiales bacterium]|nr:F0F1 ATP synthase subunit A [Clostridiales bacterium]
MRVLLAASWWTEFWEAFKDEIGKIKFFDVSHIGEEIRHGILQWQGSFTLGGRKFLITDAIIVTWIAVFLGGLLFIWLGHKRDKLPGARQSLMESLINLMLGLCKNYGMNDEQAEKVVPMIGTIGIFLISCNTFSIFKLPPPAKNIAFPFAMAIFAIIYVAVMSIRFVGIKGFASTFLDPKAFMLPFKIIDFFIKPVSLALRLFGNVFGAFILMEFVSIVIPIFLPGVLSLWFDLFDGILQAIVFCYLTTSYIGEAIESAHVMKERKEEKLKAQAEKEAANATAGVEA